MAERLWVVTFSSIKQFYSNFVCVCMHKNLSYFPFPLELAIIQKCQSAFHLWSVNGNSEDRKIYLIHLMKPTGIMK